MTLPPSSTASDCTVLSACATILTSIFIAETVAIGSPSDTACPTLTKSASTTPDIGEARWPGLPLSAIGPVKASGPAASSSFTLTLSSLPSTLKLTSRSPEGSSAETRVHLTGTSVPSSVR